MWGVGYDLEVGMGIGMVWRIRKGDGDEANACKAVRKVESEGMEL